MELNDLKTHIDRRFLKKRHGISDVVILKDVRRSKVTLQHPDRVDRFTLSVSEFTKFYKPLESKVVS